MPDLQSFDEALAAQVSGPDVAYLNYMRICLSWCSYPHRSMLSVLFKDPIMSLIQGSNLICRT